MKAKPQALLTALALPRLSHAEAQCPAAPCQLYLRCITTANTTTDKFLWPVGHSEASQGKKGTAGLAGPLGEGPNGQRPKD